jgi:two-component system chemotaxis response regulator CheB
MVVGQGANAESRAHEAPWIIVLAASAGGVQALRTIVAALPGDLPAAVAIVLHRPPDRESDLVEILRTVAHMPVIEAENDQEIEPGIVYIARPDAHLTVTRHRRFMHRDGRPLRHLHSSANPLLETAAEVFDGRIVAVVLSGSGTDATDGVQAVRRRGGYVIAQDKATSSQWGMPAAAVAAGAVDYLLPLNDIAPALEAIVHGAPVPNGDAQALE